MKYNEGHENVDQPRERSGKSQRRELTMAGFTVTWNAPMEPGNFSAIYQLKS